MKTILLAALLLAPAALAQRGDTNYDEARVSPYTLPDPLLLRSGEQVRDAAAWETRRRPEVFELFEKQMFGRAPGKPEMMTFDLGSLDKSALGGKAVRKLVTITVSGKVMNLLLYLPAAAGGAVPVFVGLNFGGNHTVHADPGIPVSEEWLKDKAKDAPLRELSKVPRGAGAGEWQVEKILARGYALATMDYHDIEPDFDGGIQYGMRPLFFRQGQTAPDPDEWGAIGAWAWGLSRIADYLVTDSDIDARRIALIGHSRLGKTALWAGARDMRFALVISNDSGEGGAALSHRNFGETVKNLNTAFPHWFCGNYKQYSGREAELPFDAHMLIALMAPRPVYVASAEDDKWADPRGEFLAAVGAGRVYQLFGKQGIGTDRMPPVNHPVGDTVRYHIRTGKHDVTEYDWEQYLNFADKHLRNRH